MLGTLAHDEGRMLPLADMPELERLMLHRLSELDEVVRAGYDAFDFKRIARRCSTSWWSSCRRSISTSARTRSIATRRRASAAGRGAGRCAICSTIWPRGGADVAFHDGRSVAGAVAGRAVRSIWNSFPTCLAEWRDDALAEKWRKMRRVRGVVTAALEIERAKEGHRLVAGSGARGVHRRCASCMRRSGCRPCRGGHHQRA